MLQGWKIFLLLAITSALNINQIFAQGSAGTDAKIEPRYLIDLPTAGMIPHGNLALDMDVYQGGGLLVGTSIGLFDRLLIGISYGGANLIGNEKPKWNETPGFQIRVRLFNETVVVPAIALGFDSQGKEIYNPRLDRYMIKSLGFFAVASKNYEVLGYLSFHGGINYSLERSDGDKDPNVFVGAEKSVGPIMSILGEYNIGWNDSNEKALGRGRGYLNIGIRLSVGKGFSVGVNLKDVLKNQREITVGNRTMIIEYVKSL
jgi:hypothetical protein